MSEINTPSSTKKSYYSETSSSAKDKKDSTKSPKIISQISGYLDSSENETNDDCLLTVLELNNGQPKLDHTESYNKSISSEKPKKFRINLVRHKKDLERRKSQLLEEREMFVSRLKRFPGYIISNIMCINQGDFELPSQAKLEQVVDVRKPIGEEQKASISSKQFKQKTTEKPSILPKKILKFPTPQEALKFYDNANEVKIKNEDDFDKEMIRKFPLGEHIIKTKWHLLIIYVPDCEFLRKLFIGYYSLNSMNLNNDEFENWCHKNSLFNSKWMYESYFKPNGEAREGNSLLNNLMIKYQVGIVLSDFFRNRDFAAYRALGFFSDNSANAKLCCEDFKSKLPVNILPYLHENPDDENSLAPNDFEEIDYFRRNYHRLMFSEDVFF